MTLDQYLRQCEMTEAAFGARVGVRQSVVHRWRTGKAVPRALWMQRIFEASEGAVRPADFYSEPAARASAEVAA